VAAEQKLLSHLYSR